MPINVYDKHWYLAVVKIGEKDVKLSMLNNTDMRNTDTEKN